jgi:polyphosphate kinase
MPAHSRPTADENGAEPPVDLHDPALYINRELSWLEFNQRVLEEARDPSNALLERLKFLTIAGSNLDEFFMVRVAGLKRQVGSQVVLRGPDGLTSEEQLRAIAARCHAMVGEQYSCLRHEVLTGLAREGIIWRRMADLTAEQAAWVKDFFHRQVFPVLTPLALDPAHPFPHLRNRSLNLLVTLRRGRLASRPQGISPPDRGRLLAVVQVPAVIPRLVQVPGPGYQFVLLEDVIHEQIAEVFQGMKVVEVAAFRITRDSDLNFDEDEVEDLLETIEQELRRREWGDAVRLEVAGDIGAEALARVMEALDLTADDVYPIDGPLNLADFMALYRLPEYAALRDAPYIAPVVKELRGKRDIFAVLRKRDILLHHPFESFRSVVEFVEQAADDPNVLAIKQTLYRTSGDSPIVAALARAAQNGKQVTALVELKARFDEQNNIEWARALERAGVHVVYGLVGLKTHCKVLLVVRREPGEARLSRYVHMGTGNYHPSTARLYTDLGLLTSSLEFGQVPRWRKLAVAPVGLRERVLELIEREIEHARAGRTARIAAQMNSLVDPEVIEALYRASRAGVKVDLVVRGICCLRAGVPGVSENIRVISIVGRFLEHCRILYVANGGQGEVFLTSGDWMPRNLSRRVETLFPIEDPALARRLLQEILELRLRDNVKARELMPDGSYRRVTPRRGQRRVNSQELLLARALQEHLGDQEAPFPEGGFQPRAEPEQRHGALTEQYPLRAEPPLPAPEVPAAADDEVAREDAPPREVAALLSDASGL